MEVKMKNGHRVLLCKIQAKKEGTGNAAGRKVVVKCMYTAYNDGLKREELVSEWISFWDGDLSKGHPQLYTDINRLPNGTWIVVLVGETTKGKDVSALAMLSGPGRISACQGTNFETNVIVGKAEPSSKKQVVHERSVYNVVTSYMEGDVKIWNQISFWNGDKNPCLAENVESIVSAYKGPYIFICGKATDYNGKGNAFSFTGFRMEKFPKNECLAQGTDGVSEDKQQSQSLNVFDKTVITIGVHHRDKPVLSSLEKPLDLQWLETVCKYYTPQGADEQRQVDTISRYLNSKGIAV